MSNIIGNDPSTSSNPPDSLDTLNEKPYTDQGINEKIVQKIRSLIDIGKIHSSDIDNRVCEQLRSFPDDITSIDTLFNEFNNSDLTGVVNKGAFLCNFIKQWKIQNPQQPKSSSNDSQGLGDHTHKPGPDEAKLKQIIERTGYKTEVTAGQRKYGGPPPDGPERPAYHSEVRRIR
jgi:heterogeneous nuclear ribonucleoprotein R